MINDKLTKELQELINENKLDIENMKKDYVYSTNEIYTGRRWIDNKKIYKRTIVYIPATPSQNITINNLSSYIPNYDTVFIDCTHSFCKRQNYNQYFVLPDKSLINVSSASSSDNLQFTDLWLSVEKMILTLEYTKTTD